SKLGKGKRINNVEDVLTLGQEIEVIVEDVDEKGKVSLTPGESWNPVIPEGAASSGGGDRDRGERSDRGGDRDRNDRGGDRDRGPRRERSSAPAAAPTTDGVAVSFDDAFDAELAGDLGDLGPGGEAGGNAGGGNRDRNDAGGDRGRRRHR
ncbi:MAG TPA: hypothetical protein PK020_02325, partial [Ilumatobacteraceae bacterium]|nr:hypothetical protein [Ilumatobacteraceae bacterium]